MAGGLRVVSRRARQWTPEEDQIIRDHYPTGGAKGVLKLLPHRANGSISSRASTLGIASLNAKKRGREKGWTSPPVPRFLRGKEEGSHEWYRAQQLAFAEAMKNNPTERPT